MKTHFDYAKSGFACALSLLLLIFSSCGRQAYQVVPATEQQASPGNFSVPAKVDIILAEDNDGAMFGSYAQVAQQFPAFLSGLQSSGWDYHFAAIPLSTDEPITQAFASTYDANWGALWIPAYPGAQQWITGSNGQETLPPDSLSSNVFTIPQAGSNAGFIQATQISNSQSGSEPGFQTIAAALTNRVQGTGIIRPDALLVVMVLAVTEDTSLVNECQRSDGIQGACELIGTNVLPCTSGTAQSNYVAGIHVANAQGNYGVCGTYQMSLNNYQTQFQSVKSSTSQFQFYAAVAAESETGSSCVGTNSFQGSRYMDMAADTGGSSFDICSQQFSTVLTSLGSSLQSVKLGYRTAYLFISQVPNVGTINVTKYLGGNTSQAVTISQDPNNGWTYAGQVTNVNTIDYPVPMDQASGIAIQLHGSAELVGNDTASVTYTPAGATNSVSN